MATKTKKKPARKAAKPSRNGKPKRPKQQTIADWGPPVIPELDKLAGETKSLESERMRLAAEENKKRDLLGIAMKKHGLTHYEFDSWDVDMVAGEVKPKIRRRTPAEVVRAKVAEREARDGE